MTVRHSRLRRTSRGIAVTCAAIATLVLVSVAWRLHVKPRQWLPGEVPIAFWAWRNEPPSDGDLREAIKEAGTQTLFLRAGQIDFQDGALHRIRRSSGSLPQGIKLHLVYNATRLLLAQLENVDENSLASSISEAFARDTERGRENGATIAGLQVDIDVPTRLLARYAKALSALRNQLPASTKLSITGLSTWMDSPALSSVLDQVDFWVPQFYGSEIPERLEQSIPISSPRFVAQAVARARELNHPFYAGLAAYSYALLYSSDGSLITLRGDMNPSQVANDENLELIEARTFADTKEWRYVYRARGSDVIEGLAMNSGDFLVIDSPGTESLRRAARAVRENAGDKLLGVCVFRLPGETDAATLKMKQIVAAIGDVPPRVSISAAMTALPQKEQPQANAGNEFRLVVVNDGTEGLATGDGLTFDLAIPAGSVAQTSLKGFSSMTTLCSAALGDPRLTPLPCSERRANVLRFQAATLAPGDRAEAMLTLHDVTPAVFSARIRIQSDDSQTHVLDQELIVADGARK